MKTLLEMETVSADLHEVRVTNRTDELVAVFKFPKREQATEAYFVVAYELDRKNKLHKNSAILN